MSMYHYRGKNLNGRIVSGTVEEDSISAVIDFLGKKGIFPLDIQEKKHNSSRMQIKQWIKKFELLTTKVLLEEVQHFCFQLSILLEAGVPLINALNKLSLTEDNLRLKLIISDIANEVSNGNSLSAAFSRYPNVFPELIVPMVRIGENTGRLGKVLGYLALFIDKQVINRKRLRKALSYPIFVLLFAVGATIALCYWVVPKFSAMFIGLGVELPKVTILLLSFSNFLTKYIGWLFLGTLGMIISYKKLIRIPTIRLKKDQLCLKIPIFNKLIVQAIISQFSWTLGLMIKSGVPLLNALASTADVLSNKYIGSQLMDVRAALERGESFSQNIADRKLFTPIADQMLEIAEESQQLDTMLTELADIYDRELSYTTDKITFLIEPLLMVIIGGVVMVMVLGIYFPMWDVIKAVQ